ncbi:hypothetical protein DFH06DRAFT_1352341 [Mycena polygramma]|nr:hypothetical protein DFH06DRAFT_1352341 [Mycena polygramma]
MSDQIVYVPTHNGYAVADLQHGERYPYPDFLLFEALGGDWADLRGGEPYANLHYVFSGAYARDRVRDPIVTVDDFVPDLFLSRVLEFGLNGCPSKPRPTDPQRAAAPNLDPAHDHCDDDARLNVRVDHFDVHLGHHLRMNAHDKFEDHEKHDGDSRNRYYLVKAADRSWSVYTQYHMGHAAGRKGDVRTYGSRHFLDEYLRSACRNKIAPCSLSTTSSSAAVTALTASSGTPSGAASGAASGLTSAAVSATAVSSSGLCSAAILTSTGGEQSDDDAPPYYEEDDDWRQSWWWFYLEASTMGFLTRDKNVADSQLTKPGSTGVGFRATFRLAASKMRELLDLSPDENMYYVLEDGQLSINRDSVHTEYVRKERKGSVLCCAANIDATSTYIKEMVYMGLV